MSLLEAEEEVGIAEGVVEAIEEGEEVEAVTEEGDEVVVLEEEADASNVEKRATFPENVPTQARVVEETANATNAGSRAISVGSVPREEETSASTVRARGTFPEIVQNQGNPDLALTATKRVTCPEIVPRAEEAAAGEEGVDVEEEEAGEVEEAEVDASSVARRGTRVSTVPREAVAEVEVAEEVAVVTEEEVEELPGEAGEE